MPPIFETIKVCILGGILISAIAATWTIQNWRWESKETAYLQEEQKLIQTEQNKQAAAATGYEKKQEATNETYKKIIDALKKAKPATGKCLDTDRMRDVNAALTRKTPNPG